MLSDLSILALALAVSLDGFGAGIAYGLRKIRIPAKSIVIIAACSGAVIYLSMGLGKWLGGFLDPDRARIIGALILIGIGLWAIYNVTRDRAGTKSQSSHDHSVSHAPLPREIFTFEIRKMGLVIQILKTPAVADVDRSGSISSSEAVLLGLALSLDAFGAGIGAAFVGMSPLFTAVLTAVMCFLFIRGGYRIGVRCADQTWVEKLSFVPGLILILFGLIKFF
ncbi:MAG: sporulation membrane protein YtaF [Bacillaceae bacterium]|nr:sporulation membrane protein YtaF [Bacillaceae bacterium]